MKSLAIKKQIKKFTPSSGFSNRIIQRPRFYIEQEYYIFVSSWRFSYTTRKISDVNTTFTAMAGLLAILIVLAVPRTRHPASIYRCGTNAHTYKGYPAWAWNEPWAYHGKNGIWDGTGDDTWSGRRLRVLHWGLHDGGEGNGGQPRKRKREIGCRSATEYPPTCRRREGEREKERGGEETEGGKRGRSVSSLPQAVGARAQ